MSRIIARLVVGDSNRKHVGPIVFVIEEIGGVMFLRREDEGSIAGRERRQVGSQTLTVEAP
jgi:hypothetical protein